MNFNPTAFMLRPIAVPLAFSVLVISTTVAVAQSCPLRDASPGEFPRSLANKHVQWGDQPAAIAFRSLVAQDDDGAPNAYSNEAGPNAALDYICSGGSVMEYKDGRLVDKYYGRLGGQGSEECKRDFVKIRDAQFPACAPNQLCMLWYGIAQVPRRCGFPSAYGGPDNMSCGTPILQPGSTFYVSTTSLSRPGSNAGSSSQSDYVDATKVPYIVMPDALQLPGNARLEMGDLAVMVWNGKTVYAVVADTNSNVGEASRAALLALGRPNGAAIGSDEGEATTLVFPGTRNLILNHWPLDPKRIEAEGKKLVASFTGGATALSKCQGFSGINN